MRVYCSIPAINRRDKTLTDIQDKICLPHVTMDYHREHDRYTLEKAMKCDVLIVMNQHGKFDFNYDSLSESVRKDIEIARDLNKPIYLAYRTTDGNLNIYRTSCGSYALTGVSGTTGELVAYLRNNVPDKVTIGSVPDNNVVRSVHDNSEQREYHAQYGNLRSQDPYQEKVVVKYDRRLLL